MEVLILAVPIDSIWINDYSIQLRYAVSKSFQLARARLQSAHCQRSKYYDTETVEVQMAPGDRVYLGAELPSPRAVAKVFREGKRVCEVQEVLSDLTFCQSGQKLNREIICDVISYTETRPHSHQ